MGGRGSSIGAGNASVYAATTVVTQSGDNADLGGMTLRYGENEKSIVPAVRASIAAFEAKRSKAKIEYSCCVGPDGAVILEKKGSRTSVSTPVYALNRADVFSHNHPRGKGEEGYIGGTFSEGDVDTLVTTNMRVFRATATEGTYSLTKGAKFDGKGLLTYYRQKQAEFRAEKNRVSGDAGKLYISGQITYQEYQKIRTREFNKMLVNLHNALLDGQKKFGYNYTLERR